MTTIIYLGKGIYNTSDLRKWIANQQAKGILNIRVPDADKLPISLPREDVFTQDLTNTQLLNKKPWNS